MESYRVYLVIVKRVNKCGHPPKTYHVFALFMRV